jgi:S1-C subfamily serine protease
MQQGDFIRAATWVTAAGAGAGLALAGAAITGNLGGSTTINKIAVTAPSSSSLPRSNGNLSVQEIYRLDAPGVVQINDRPGSTALGSGFVIDKAGHIVTSNGVVSGARGVEVSFSGGDRLAATLVGDDPSTDIAVLQVNAHSRSLTPLPLGDSDLVQVGDPVVAIGNTASLNRTAAVGIVSAVQSGVDTADAAFAGHSIQTDAAINSSNSGGPLINTRGQVIGLSSGYGVQGAGAGAGVPGIGFAVPIDTVKSVVEQLLQTGQVEHAYLGLDASPVSPALAREYALPSSYGLLVQSVARGSGAAVSGLRAGRTSVVVAGESYVLGGDLVVAANGRPVTSDAQLRDVIQAMKPGDTLSLQIWRGNQKVTVHVKLGGPPG